MAWVTVVSGPLASVVSEHSDQGVAGRAVLVQLALASHPDGTCALPKALTLGQLAHRTGLHRATVVRALDDLLDDSRPVWLEYLARGGRGTGTRYRIRYSLCPVEASCGVCDILRARPERVAPRDSFHGSGRGGKGRAERGKSRIGGRKGRTTRPTTVYDGDGTVSDGGAVPHPESGAASAPSQSAAAAPEPGPPEPASEPGEPVRWSDILGLPGRPPAPPDDPYAGMTRQEEEAAKRAKAEQLLAADTAQEGRTAS
jgi:hypothetical protein